MSTPSARRKSLPGSTQATELQALKGRTVLVPAAVFPKERAPPEGGWRAVIKGSGKGKHAADLDVMFRDESRYYFPAAEAKKWLIADEVSSSPGKRAGGRSAGAQTPRSGTKTAVGTPAVAAAQKRRSSAISAATAPGKEEGHCRHSSRLAVSSSAGATPSVSRKRKATEPAAAEAGYAGAGPMSPEQAAQQDATGWEPPQEQLEAEQGGAAKPQPAKRQRRAGQAGPLDTFAAVAAEVLATAAGVAITYGVLAQVQQLYNTV